MIKTAPRSTLSPQMWSIKNKKKIGLQEFVKLVERKIRSDLFSKNLFSTPYVL